MRNLSCGSELLEGRKGGPEVRDGKASGAGNLDRITRLNYLKIPRAQPSPRHATPENYLHHRPARTTVEHLVFGKDMHRRILQTYIGHTDVHRRIIIPRVYLIHGVEAAPYVGQSNDG